MAPRQRVAKQAGKRAAASPAPTKPEAEQHGVASAVALLIVAFLIAGLPALVAPHWDAFIDQWLGTDDFTVYVAGNFAVAFATTVVGNLMWLAAYIVQWPYLEQFKVNAAAPWPWTLPAKERGRFWHLVRASVGWSVVNGMIILPVASALNWDVAKFFGFRARGPFPSMAEIAGSLVIFALVEDFLFYFAHRLLHENKTLYVKVHKMHHVYTYTVAIAVLHLRAFFF